MECTHFTPQNQLTLSAELRNVIQERNILTTRTRMKVLSDLDSVRKASDDEKRISLRNKAIQEILTSEVSYLHSLETVMKYFMVPLEQVDFISTTTFNTLFGHIRMLYKVNGELLYELKLNADCIAEAFLRLAPFFKLYSVYAYDYKQVLSILQDIGKKNTKLNTFIKNQECHPEVAAKLPSLLITPIQRIPRYRLLLQEVLSLTPKSHKDYTALVECLHAVEQVAKHINNLVQEQESMEHIIRLQNSLTGGLPQIVVPGRRVLKEGVLMKVSPNGKVAHPRHFILFNDMLMYCKIKKSNTWEPNSLQCCCVMPLKKCTVTEVLSKGMFKITCHSVTFLVYTVSVHEGELWISAINDALKQYHENRQTLRKDSSSRRPMRRFDILREVNHNTSLKTLRKRKRSEKFVDDKTQYQENKDPNRPSVHFGPAITISPEKRSSVSKIKKYCNETLFPPETQAKKLPENDTKDCLYPLRESVKRRRYLASFHEGETITQIKINEGAITSSDLSCSSEQVWKLLPESLNNTTSQNLSGVPLTSVDSWHVKTVGLIKNFIAGMGYRFRKHILRRPLRVPNFNN